MSNLSLLLLLDYNDKLSMSTMRRSFFSNTLFDIHLLPLMIEYTKGVRCRYSIDDPIFGPVKRVYFFPRHGLHLLEFETRVLVVQHDLVLCIIDRLFCYHEHDCFTIYQDLVIFLNHWGELLFYDLYNGRYRFRVEVEGDLSPRQLWSRKHFLYCRYYNDVIHRLNMNTMEWQKSNSDEPPTQLKTVPFTTIQTLRFMPVLFPIPCPEYRDMLIWLGRMYILHGDSLSCFDHFGTLLWRRSYSIIKNIVRIDRYKHGFKLCDPILGTYHYLSYEGQYGGIVEDNFVCG